MRTFLEWLDKVEKLGKVIETDTVLQIDMPDEVLDDAAAVELLSQAGLALPPQIFMRVENPQRHPPYLPQKQDVALPDDLMPCPEHESQYAELFAKQEAGRELGCGTRLALLRSMQACPACKLRLLKLEVIINKDRKSQDKYWDSVGLDWPDGVDCKLWFDSRRVASHTPLKDYLQWAPRPLVIGVRGLAPIEGDYVSCVELATDTFPQDAVNAAARLAGRKDAIRNLLKDRPLTGAGASRILSPDYWVGQVAIDQSGFPDILPLACLFLISLLGQVCHRVEREADETYIFQVEGAPPMTLRCQLTGSGIILENEAQPLTSEITSRLLHFYQEAVRGKPQGQNLDLLQQAVRIAGGADLRSLITETSRVENYYNFQWKTLLKSRFKEQVNVIESYLNAVQTARSKVSAAMDELYKNLTSVVSGAAAVAAVLLTAAVTKNTQIYDYLIIAGVLIVCPYVPVHVLRAMSLVAAAESDLQQFRSDLDKSARDLDFPMEVLDVGQMRASQQLLRSSVGITATWLSVIMVLGLATAVGAYTFGYSDVKSLLPRWVVIIVMLAAGGTAAGMILRFWRGPKPDQI